MGEAYPERLSVAGLFDLAAPTTLNVTPTLGGRECQKVAEWVGGGMRRRVDVLLQCVKKEECYANVLSVAGL